MALHKIPREALGVRSGLPALLNLANSKKAGASSNAFQTLTRPYQAPPKEINLLHEGKWRPDTGKNRMLLLKLLDKQKTEAPIPDQVRD